MHFAAVGYFLLLPLIFVFMFLISSRNKNRYKSYINFSQYDIVKKLKKSNRIKIYSLIKIINFIILLLFIIALAKPQIGTTTEDVLNNGADIVIALDISSSMEALDFKPINRLEAAKKIAIKFISDIKYDRVGIVLFSGMAFTQAPLTNDMNSIATLIGNASPALSAIDGTAIGSAIATACNRLKDSEAKSKVIVLITDGVNNIGEIDPITAAEIAQTLKIKIYTIGAGAKDGAYHKTIDNVTGQMKLVKLAEEELDEDMLTRIAEITGGQYFRATDTDSLNVIMKQIGAMEKTKASSVKFTSYQDIFDKLILLLLCLILLNILLENLFLRKLI